MQTGRIISREALILLVLCTLDMLSSAWLFHHNLAIEANPVLRPAAEAGVFSFMSAKALTFLPAIVMCEWYRRHRPAFVIPLLRWAGYGYACVYTLMVARQFIG
jgi:hypothetical protein